MNPVSLNKKFAKFSNWKKFDKENLPLDPGVYSIAYSKDKMEGQNFAWDKEIIYFGMTSKQTLKDRIENFFTALKIFPNNGHGGGQRVMVALKIKKRETKYEELLEKLYVSHISFPCDLKINRIYMAIPEGQASEGEGRKIVRFLKTQGKIKAFEDECLASFVSTHGRLPDGNNEVLYPKP